MVKPDLTSLCISFPPVVGTIDYQFQMDTYTVDERGGNIGVRLDILSPGNLFCDITVTLGTVDGTAGIPVKVCMYRVGVSYKEAWSILSGL